ncbi:MAG: hypothetical protein NT007_12285 [Candidatus Kapabacteria bacterium]|nr:hypothetical protein [Candidatus Kapabacteria bacterium]
MKYSKAITESIVMELRQGNGRVRTCKAVGITHETFMNWITKYSEFSDTIKKAEKAGIMLKKEEAEQCIREAQKKQWQAAAWFLERKFPKEYGRKENIEMHGNMKNDIKMNMPILSPVPQTEEEMELKDRLLVLMEKNRNN